MLTDIPVRLGVQVAPEHAEYAEIRDAARRIEDAGADLLFTWDHFYPLTGDPDGLHFESWSILAAWAEQTDRIQLGALVNCNSYRNPDLQADMARTIDHISARDGTGRFVFGTGSGWAQRDYVEYGFPFGTAGSRLDDLAESLDRIRRRWQVLNPPPTRPIPVMIGGSGEQKTLRLVARHADIWHSFTRPEQLPHKLDVLRRWAEVEQRDLSNLVVSNELGRRSEDRADELYDAGVRMFTLNVKGPAYDHDLIARWLRWRDAKNA